MNAFKDAVDITAKNIYQIQSLYNKDSTLEFVIQPQRDFIFPNEIYLNFSVELNKNYVMDNQADKLFDSVEIIINNEKISSRSNSNEYFLGSFFQVKSNHPVDHFNNVLRPEGWWGSKNLSAAEMLAHPKQEAIDERSPYTKKIGDKIISRVYNFSMQIHTPLFQQLKPLPSDVPIHINFKRSKPEVAILKITTDDDTTYSNKQIDLINPYLDITVIQSDKLRKRLDMSRKNTLEYPVEMGVIRTHTIDDGLNHVRFNATTGGKLPVHIFTALMSPEAFHGDFALSSTRFERFNLKKLELFVDNKNLPGSQVNISDDNLVEAYTKFYRQCKLIPNVYTGRLMGIKEFTETNFMTAYDMSSVDINTGWLTIDLDFAENIPEKLMLIVYMVFDQTIKFDKDRNVSVT